jgi:hypothetical protein
MAAKLDTKKPYGEVYGVNMHRYEQDGKKFDAQGVEIVDKSKPDPKPQSTAKPGTDKPSEQLDEQLKG